MTFTGNQLITNTRSFTNGVGIRSLEVRRSPTAGKTWQIYSMQTATIAKGNKALQLQPVHLYVCSVGHADMLGGVCCRWFLDDVLGVLGKLVARSFTIHVEFQPNDGRFLFRNLREVLHQVQSHMRRCNPGQDQIVKQICCVLSFY